MSPTSPAPRPSSTAAPTEPVLADALPSAHIAFEGNDQGLATGAGLILHTADGGTTWQRVLAASGPVRDLHWLGPQDAIAVSADGVMVSHDGGLTWHPASLGPMGRRVVLLEFPDEQTGFAVTAEGQLWSVSQDAAHWLRQENTGLGTVSSVSFVNPQIGWAAGPQGVSMTADGGRTWTVQAAPSIPGLPRPPLIHFADIHHGYVVEGFGPGAGTVYSGLMATDDGGGHWSYRSGPAGRSGPPTPLFASMPGGVDDVVVEGAEGLLAVSVSDVVSGQQACTSGDGGRHWMCTPQALTHPAQIGTEAAAIVRLPNGRLVVASLTTTSLLRLITSADGGAMWSLQTQVPVRTL